mmetsp:Transcript_103078/g.210197  ORF Transcript_103078/g.210197 Transcript_103078/m.210197 type:complete len:258 (-) Transcript_103078:191-964(-)
MSRSPLAQTAQRPGRNNWRQATKRQILGNFANPAGRGESYSSSSSSSSGKIDGSNADHVKLVIDRLQEKHDQIVTFLKSDLEDCKLEQEEFLSTGLIKLPRAVRNMSVRDFNRQHSCNLLALLKSKDGVVVAGPAPKNPSGIDANKKRCYETPAVRMRRPPQLGSILRTARRGEGLFSQNGSPVAATEPGTVIATVCKKRRGNESASVEINVGEGQYISLNDPSGVSGLDVQMKQTAASQLKVLQDQMASLMAQLQQ